MKMKDEKLLTIPLKGSNAVVIPNFSKAIMNMIIIKKK